MQLPPGAIRPPSSTFVFGPFGEVVSFDSGSIFLTWYPTCLAAVTSELEPPDCPVTPGEPLRSRILSSTYENMSEMVLGLRNVPAASVENAIVKDGVIVAWGSSNIDDPESESHRTLRAGDDFRRPLSFARPGKIHPSAVFRRDMRRADPFVLNHCLFRSVATGTAHWAGGGGRSGARSTSRSGVPGQLPCVQKACQGRARPDIGQGHLPRPRGELEFTGATLGAP